VRNINNSIVNIGQLVLIIFVTIITIIFYIILKKLFATVLRYLFADRDSNYYNINFNKKFLTAQSSSQILLKIQYLFYCLIILFSRQLLLSVFSSFRADIYEFAKNQN